MARRYGRTCDLKGGYPDTSRRRILDRLDLAGGAGAETLRVVRMVLVAARAASAR